METEKPSIKPIAYQYGLYLGLLSIIGLVIMYVANIEKSWIMSIISLILTIVIYVYGIKAYQKANYNFLSIKEAIKVGLGMAAVGGVIAALYTFIHYSYIQPEFFENIREQSYIEMTKKNPNMVGEQLDTALKMMNFFTSPFFMSTMILISSLFFGLIISLITGAILKKENTHA